MPDHADQAAPPAVVSTSAKSLSPEAEEKILALDPNHVTQRDVRDVLAQAPAPQILNIHGGLLPLKSRMTYFAEFLIQLGYPESSLRIPSNGSFSYGYYDASDRIAGSVAWYYERDGLRPMLIGHSQGGMQTVRVLHRLAGKSNRKIAVWNPLTGSEEKRYAIVDPLTGKTRPVVGVQLSYATAALAGGAARILPNEWDMNSKLREIPDSVDEFTGFQKGMDFLGGDFLGYGSVNDYHASGKAIVHNVRLPSAGGHSSIPDSRNLLEDEAVKDWIVNYLPAAPVAVGQTPKARFGSKTARIIWAAEVW
jgi:pimeloyl-ACP methyl ester carboxylesterase